MVNPRLRAWPFFVAALGLLAGFIAVYIFFVRTYAGQVVDERAFNGAYSQHDAVATFSEHFLDVVPVIAFGAGIVLTLAIGIATRRWRQLIAGLVVAGVACVLAELSKYVFLSRPETGATDPFGNSFPSGHTTVAAAAAFAVFLVTAPRWRPVAALAGGAFAVLTGILALVSQWHRPSDVVAGLILVAICGCLGTGILAMLGLPAARQPSASLGWLWWITAIAAAVSLVAFVLIYASVADHGRHLEIAYVGGVSAVLAVGAGFTAAGTRLFRTVA
ncbi:phosphatase PAP2 family protein [Humibacter sp.]|uniref:phosphatase PAP2 family protein n=1 Tax=Humibacter sp. TaxID=1940291 RepID=UPI003F819604